MGKLTVAGINSLVKPGRYGDGGTLFLYVAPGARSLGSNASLSTAIDGTSVSADGRW